jgi:hypothetical protein
MMVRVYNTIDTVPTWYTVWTPLSFFLTLFIGGPLPQATQSGRQLFAHGQQPANPANGEEDRPAGYLIIAQSRGGLVAE